MVRLGRDGAIETERLNVLSGFFDVFRIRVQALDQVAFVGAEGGGHSPSPQPVWTTRPPFTPVLSRIFRAS